MSDEEKELTRPEIIEVLKDMLAGERLFTQDERKALRFAIESLKVDELYNLAYGEATEVSDEKNSRIITSFINDLKRQMEIFNANYVSEHLTIKNGYIFTCSLSKCDEDLDGGME